MSTVHFYCVHCGTTLEDSSGGHHDLVKCHACTRHVPVPRRARGPGNFAAFPQVFPPEVLDLLIKFACTACRTVLYADARCEGRDVVCSSCAAHTSIPRWSVPAGGEKMRSHAPRLVPAAEPPTLSAEEIDFLRGMKSMKPEAAA